MEEFKTYGEEKYKIEIIKEFDNPNVRLKYGVLCGAVGIFFNIILFTGKLIAGTLTGSIGFTVMVRTFDVTGFAEMQEDKEEVSSQVTISPFDGL